MKTLAVFLTLLFTSSVHAQKPSNDECINATVIPSNRGITSNYSTVPVDIKNTTANDLDPITNCSQFDLETPMGTDGNTLWYSWQPTQRGEVTFTTDGSPYPTGPGGFEEFREEIITIIGVYKGDNCASIEEIRCGFPNEKVRAVNIVENQQYYIKVGVFQRFRGGKLKLTVGPAPPTPSNSKCDKAVDVNPVTGQTVTGEISSAEIDEASFPCADRFFGFYKGLWYKFKNSSPGPLSISASTCNDRTDFDSLMSIFEGDNCGTLSCVDVVDDVQGECGAFATIDFLAKANTTYYILVQGFDFSEGKFGLNVKSSSSFFSLVDSESNSVISALGNVLNYQSDSSSKLNIEAVFLDRTSIQSVLVTFDNPPRLFCELFPPYSVFWDTNGNFFDASIPVGNHLVTATPFSQAGCLGTPGDTLSKNFTAIGCYLEYAIYDVNDNCPYTYLYDDSFFGNRVSSIPCRTNIYAFAFCGFEVESIKIELRNTVSNTTIQSVTETEFPYFLYGDDEEGIPIAASISAGTYEITSTINGILHPALKFTVQGVCRN